VVDHCVSHARGSRRNDLFHPRKPVRVFYWVKFMHQKFNGTNPKYKNHSEHQLWLEYAHLKREFEKNNPTASAEEYDRFIDRIVAELGI
jgi:hypothetical protein